MRLKYGASFAVVAILVGLATVAMADRALVINETNSVVVVLDENGNFLTTIGDRIRVITNSANENTNYTAHVDSVPNSTGSAVLWDFESTGIRCGVVRGPGDLCVSSNWHQTIAASGRTTLHCTCKN